jgi:hypothetical protein
MQRHHGAADTHVDENRPVLPPFGRPEGRFWSRLISGRVRTGNPISGSPPGPDSREQLSPKQASYQMLSVHSLSFVVLHLLFVLLSSSSLVRVPTGRRI